MVSSETKTWGCLFIDSVKVNKYLLCVVRDCRKKEKPNPGNESVLCKNPTCKRKMFVSQCKKAINAELLLTDKEDDTKQITFTLFDQTLFNVIDMNKKGSEIEDDLWSLKDYDIT